MFLFLLELAVLSVAFIKAVFCGHAVDKTDIDVTFLKNGTHENSIFGKECRKFQNMKIESVEEQVTEGSNGVSAVNVLVEEIENLICSDDFDIDDNLFSEKSLGLLEEKDCLRLLKKISKLNMSLLTGNMRILTNRLLLLRNFKMSLPLTNAERETFLLFFVQNNFLSALNLLLTKNEVNINSISANGNTPLITAAELGYTECLGVLLNKCSKESVRKCVNVCNMEILTAIDIAARNGHEGCVKKLLKIKGISVNYALELAQKHGNSRCVDLLKERRGHAF